MKVEGSKFIASAYPVDSRLQAEEKLGSVRKKFFDATHHCFAYALGSEKMAELVHEHEHSEHERKRQ